MGGQRRRVFSSPPSGTSWLRHSDNQHHPSSISDKMLTHYDKERRWLAADQRPTSEGSGRACVELHEFPSIRKGLPFPPHRPKNPTTQTTSTQKTQHQCVPDQLHEGTGCTVRPGPHRADGDMGCSASLPFSNGHQRSRPLPFRASNKSNGTKRADR